MKKLEFNTIPSPAEKRVSIYITVAAQRHVRSGHPWLFEKSIKKQSHSGKSGDIAVIYDQKKKFLAAGIYDPFSPIRVRILQHRKSADINLDWFLSRFKTAHEARSPILKSDTDGYRVIHGENDGLPGLIIDRYGDTVVIKIYSAAWVPHLADICSAIQNLLPINRAVLRMNRLSREQPKLLYGLTDGQVLFGPPVQGPIVFKENGLLFEADTSKGQKTGFFLDQRENRKRVEKLSKGKDVLNVFSYTGGFSLYAARGGAKSVTSLDISNQAIEGAKRNFELNEKVKQISNCPKNFIANDAFKGMETLRKEKRLFDIVIIDPPSFAKKESEIEGALNGYSRLVKAGLGILRNGGVLVAASCSSRVSANEFYKTVNQAAKEVNRPLAEIERREHGIDHPIGFPEGAYLKCLFANS